MAKTIKLRIRPATGDPVKGEVESKMLLTPGKTTPDRAFDIQDRLMELVGKGNVLSPDDKASIYGGLQTAVGTDKARKIMDHIYLFNSRPDVQKLPLEQKINAFYSIGSNDPDVQSYINQTKALGYGAGAQFRGSASQINQELTGRIPVTTPMTPTESQRKIMLSVKK